MSKKVLIAGGNGFIGKQLTAYLITRGYEVSWLVRSINPELKVKQYLWKPDVNEMDLSSMTQTDVVVNLAGAGIADKRWSVSRKEQLIKSRIDAVKTLRKGFLNNKHCKLINASAIGYYGYESNQILSEDSVAGTDFLAQVCVQWEAAVNDLRGEGINTSIVRIGFVLSNAGGALPKMTLPIKWGIGSALGSGKQIISWIHIRDLLEIFLNLIETKLPAGVYNAVAPQPISNKELTYKSAEVLNRKIFLPNIPSLLLKIIFGEMSTLFLNGNKVSAHKLLNSGFQFKYPTIDEALKDLL